MSEIIAQDEMTTTFRTPDGQEVRVARNQISDPTIREKIAAFESSPGVPSGAPSGSEFSQPLPLGAPMKQAPLPSFASSQKSPAPVEAPAMPEAPVAESAPGPIPEMAAEPSLADSGLQKQTSGIYKEAKALEEQGKRDAIAYASFEQESAKINQQMAEIEKKRAEDEAKHNAQVAEADKALVESKPKDFWADRSTGARIGAAIAVAMGAYASATTGGPNYAQQILDSAINRDIERQKSEYEKLKDRRSGLNTVFSQMMQKYGDERQALLATKSASLEMAKVQILKNAALAQGDVAKGKGMQMVGAVEQEQAKTRGELSAKYAESAAKQQEENYALEVPGFGAARTKEDAKELKDALVQKRKMDSQIQELISLRETYGGEVVNRNAVARAKQLSKDLLLTYKNLAKLGVLSKADEDIINEIIPGDPLEFTPVASMKGQDPILAKLKGFQRDSDQDFQTKLATRMRNYAPSEAVETKTVAGRMYRKVPGGWKEVK